MSQSLARLPGTATATGWQLPDNLSEHAWTELGRRLGHIERSVMWWIGDWWAYGEARFGERKAIVSAPGWDGPSFQTCANAASVCRAFDASRRREALSFTHHAEVAGLDDTPADDLLDDAEAASLSTRDLRSAVHRLRTARGGQPSSATCTLTDLNALVSSGVQFGCIYADPPWRYDNQATRASTGNHYLGMTVEELCAMPVRDLAAADAHLHLWTTNAFLFEAPRIFTAWGFEFRSSFVWVKSSIGIGNYWRNSHEFLLTGIRGNATRFYDHSLRSWLECSRGEHSAKPEQVRAMLERASPAPYLELFGRLPAERWTVWGDQVERNLFSPQQEAAE